MDNKGWLSHDTDEWEGTYYLLDDLLFSYPEAITYMRSLGFSDEELHEYFDLLEFVPQLI